MSFTNYWAFRVKEKVLLEELLEEADIDRDGTIFYDEFIAMISKVGHWTEFVVVSKTKPSQCFVLEFQRPEGKINQ